MGGQWEQGFLRLAHTKAPKGDGVPLRGMGRRTELAAPMGMETGDGVPLRGMGRRTELAAPMEKRLAWGVGRWHAEYMHRGEQVGRLGWVFCGVAWLWWGGLGLMAQTSMLPAGGVLSMGLQRPDVASAIRTVVPVSGQGFSQAVRVVTMKVPANPWGVQLSVGTSGPVNSGDVLAGEIWLRRVASGEGAALAEIVFERAGPPYDQSLVRVLPDETGDWTRYRFAFTSLATHATGGAQFNIRLGYGEQTLEMGGLTLTNHARTAPLSAFVNDLTYAGREADAGWRVLADEAIERHRKADFTVELRDAEGFPMGGVPVGLKLVRHGFGFGSAVAASRLLAVGTDSDRYRGVITQWFNTVVLENDLKWPEHEANPGRARSAVTWLRQRDLAVRGHTLIWPGTNSPWFLPADVPGLFGDVARLRSRINGRFTNILERFRGEIVEWDVVNEPLHERAVEGVMGRAEVASWFQLARNLDPRAVLYLNEYANIESATRVGVTNLRVYAEDLRSRGAPVDALGLQGHFSGFLASPVELWRRFDLLSGQGAGVGPGGEYPLRITEFDVNVSDERVQGDYTRDFLTAAFAHPAVTGVLLWGFWENQHWLPPAALFRRNWEPKPNALAWSNLVHRVWTTEVGLVSSPAGVAGFRGFKGEYEVVVNLPGGPVTHRGRLEDGSVKMSLVLPTVRPELGWDADGFHWGGSAGGYRLERNDRLEKDGWNEVGIEPAWELGRWRVGGVAVQEPGYYRLRRGAGTGQ